jgi:hypothetical protein
MARDVWVGNDDGTGNAACGSVTELDASTGAVVRVLAGGHYSFDMPDAIVGDGTHIWVASLYDAMEPCQGGAPSSVIELSAVGGAWQETILGTCGILPRLAARLLGEHATCISPDGMAATGSRIWFGNNSSSVVSIRNGLSD